MEKRYRNIFLLATMVVLIFPGLVLAQQVKMKLATVEPGDINSSPAFAAAVVFKHEVESRTGVG